MRGGSESYLIKDSAFYQSKMAAALGVDTVAVYEELRAHVWRSRSRGNGKMRAEVRKGHLSVGIRRQTLADSTGLSVKTVQRRVNLLREIGWVRSENGQPLGGALVYELGHVIQGGMEVFYADMDCREFCLYLEELADRTEEQVYSIPVLERVRLAKEWVTRKDRGLYRANGGGSESPTPSVTESHLPPGGGSESPSVIDNPSGERIDKSEEYVGRCAPTHSTGPEPEHWNDPAGQERRRRSQKKKKDQEGSSAEFAIDSALDSRQDEDRFARAAEAGTIGKTKADHQQAAKVEKVTERLTAKRTEQVQKGDADEQRVRNLKGGTKFTHAVLKASRCAWDLYTTLTKDSYPMLPVVRWNAEGNAKARGQMYRLVDMYGGDAVEQTLRFVVGNWDSINVRFFKKGPGSVPNFALLLSMHESLFREAAMWGEHREVMEEWEAWQSGHEDDDETPPSELQGRYETARTALESLGLGS